MHESQYRKKRTISKPIFGIIVNDKAAAFSQKSVDLLVQHLAAAGANWHIIQSPTSREAVFQIRKLMQRHPVGVIAAGGDSTVNMAASHMIRRTCALGILPLGRYNNIYRSLCGEPKIKDAIAHILSGQSRKIDYGVAANRFFLNSIGLGLVPELAEALQNRKSPSFGISWSRLAAQSAARIVPRQITLTIDAFRFEISPLLLNINILSHTLGLNLTPTSSPGDGLAEIIFEAPDNKAILSNFIRKIYKEKYLYEDEIRMFRGTKIIITPVDKQRLYLDGEIIALDQPSLDIEIFPEKIRLFQKPKEERLK